MGKNEMHESGKVIRLQKFFYEQAVLEILEACNETYSSRKDIDRPIEFKFSYLFLPDGKRVRDLL